MPFSSAAKRGEVLCADPMMVAFPLHAPICSTYFREIDPLSARAPARANPRPSRIDFLPSSITCSGISSYVVVATNRPTYSVRPFVLGKSAPHAVPAPFTDVGTTLEATMPREALPKSRLSIFSPRGSDDLPTPNSHCRKSSPSHQGCTS